MHVSDKRISIVITANHVQTTHVVDSVCADELYRLYNKRLQAVY